MGLFRWRRAPAPVAGRRPERRVEPPRRERLPGGMGEGAWAALFQVGTIRRAVPGESLVRVEEAAGALLVVVEGAAADLASSLVLEAGDCLGDPGDADRTLPTSLAAREPSTVLVVPGPAFRLLPVSDRDEVVRWVASSTAARHAATRARQAIAAGEAEALRALVGEECRARAAVVAGLGDALDAIPRLPAFASDLLARLLDPRASAPTIVEGIKNDPALAALVLKTVNSPYYAPASEIADYYHAFLYLGTHQVYQLVLSSGLETLTRGTPGAERSLVHARLVSLVAGEIARLSGRPRPEVATTVALLHDIGETVAPMVAQKRPHLAPLLAGLDTTALGAALLERWGLPDRVVIPIARQREPQAVPADLVEEAYRDEIGVLHVAHLCHDLLVGTPTPPHRAFYAESYLAWLGLAERSCADLYQQRIVPAITAEAYRLPAPVIAALPVALRP